MRAGQGAAAEEAADDHAEEKKKLAAEVAIMQPILRFLQLLCENHNTELQVSLGIDVAFIEYSWQLNISWIFMTTEYS